MMLKLNLFIKTFGKKYIFLPIHLKVFRKAPLFVKIHGSKIFQFFINEAINYFAASTAQHYCFGSYICNETRCQCFLASTFLAPNAVSIP